ncbi:aminotransferase class I/II-fold pyridoxal phosphate-dependent enzyme [Paenibacillus filicis]|uniref:Aminotransferase class I/II-fold pyridoxal phosphate-dependent enzyme n=1 Tax=Paenibacillus gyeongsangnamensis TaxID=3388067 RepID=A0ABT4QFW2_9BACL|nr:aminotransferase class I/II-fold pyridoxal phosphate-dependent enzyme [Paenibacillus filicis]MCZ8515631.1 aminotransferase class I/II-fold pyridoxal phosphate-dependent enzyme [Paenibacillus filicis]
MKGPIPVDQTRDRAGDIRSSEPMIDSSTRVAHDPHDDRHQGAVVMPIYQNSLFTFATYEEFDLASTGTEDIAVYSRGHNPTVRQLEQRLAQLQGGGKARCFASGMAAISTAILSNVRAGDHIICIDQVYGPTRELLTHFLTRYGVETSFVDGTSLEAFQAAVRPNTKLVYLESPTTLTFRLQDLRACADLARSIGAVTIIDNTWATPVFQNPFQYGIDFVVHSISKYIGGHSDIVGGVLIGSAERISRINAGEYLLLGGIMTPQSASLTMRGLRTLPLRLEKLEQSGLTVARFLEGLPFVRKVNHPGLPSHPQHELAKKQMSGSSSLFSFETDLPAAEMKAWADRLGYFRIGVSWGGHESLVTVGRLGPGYESVTGSLVRLYVGLENPSDLIEDIIQASAGLPV